MRFTILLLLLLASLSPARGDAPARKSDAMQINHANLESIYYTLDTRFQAAFEQAPTWYEQIATEVPSHTRENRYAWIGQLPRMREWIGERMVHNLANFSHSIVNRPFELTIGVEREDIEDDQLGQYGDLAAQMGYEGKLWPQDLVSELLKTGHQQTCFDGQAFFDTDHPVDLNNPSSGTYSNLFTSKALTAPNLAEVRAAMRNLRGADGRTLRVRPNLLIVAPDLETTARTILNAEIVAPSTGLGGNANGAPVTNIMKGSMNLLVAEELSDEPTAWYVADTSRPIKPFVFQLRKNPDFVAMTNPTDPNVFSHKRFLYGLDSRGNAGFTLPFLIARAKA